MEGNNGTSIGDLRQYQQPYQQPYPPQMMHQPPQVPPQIMMQQPQMMQPMMEDMGQMQPDMNMDDVQIPVMPIQPTPIHRPNKKRPSKVQIMEKIPQSFREPIIIIVLFIIMSLDIVKQTIGNYIPQIRGNATGSVSLIGYAVYGAILAIAFETLKNILL